jgi:hypothetical protein
MEAHTYTETSAITYFSELEIRVEVTRYRGQEMIWKQLLFRVPINRAFSLYTPLVNNVTLSIA